MVHRNGRQRVVNTPLLQDKHVSCAVIREMMMERCCCVIAVTADSTRLVLCRRETQPGASRHCRPGTARHCLALPGLPPGWHTTRQPWREGPATAT